MGVALETVELTKRFGMVRAADAVSVRVVDGELIGIVGSNGSGKTTLLNLVTGYLKPDRGTIRYQGRDITGLAPRAVAALGITRSFQIPQLYPDLTAEENMLLAVAIATGKGGDFWRSLHAPSRVAEAVAHLDRFGLGDYRGRRASELPEGERKLLDIALSLARRPRVLLMDEPTSGVSVKDKFGVMDTLVRALRDDGVTGVFVEHDMEVVQRYAERVFVFHEGRVLADGAPDILETDRVVRRAVLGRD